MPIIYTDNITYADYAALETAVGWKYNEEQLAACIKGSAYVTAAYETANDKTTNGKSANSETAKAIGAARLIWDGGDDAILRDVAVLPEYQGRGIGKELVLRVINFLKENIREGWSLYLELFAESGRAGFYEKLGFVSRGTVDGDMTHMHLKIAK
jgi:GNAT superfamily N-acetyltransferase